jgi:hypothetical protein
MSETAMKKLEDLYEANEAAKAKFERILKAAFAEARCACQPYKEEMWAATKAYQKQLRHMIGMK